ncbi:MAG: HAMP domain-containing sensor histidine kinase [Melioribacteraceae bacterium]|nr:HAMP domain-containing sensor histidine kinase [Melioribacteraceae bacterium]
MKLTKTILRSAFWNSAILIFLLISFNVVFWISINYVLNKNINSKLNHEMENILNAIEISGDSLVIVNPHEFEEPDLAELTEAPFFMKIFDTNKKVILKSKNLSSVKDFDFSPYPLQEEKFFDDTKSYREELRVQYHELKNSEGNEFGFIQLATPKTGLTKIKDNLLIYNLIFAPLTVMLILFLSIFLAKRTFEPINNIINTSNEISARNLNKRLSFNAEPDDEIGRLRDTLNNLFDRLEKQVNQISNFSDNAAHQLMTPLTTLKSEIEYLSKAEHTVQEYKDSLKVLHNETEKMIHLISSMLILANDCNVCAESKQIFNISKLISNTLNSDYYKQVTIKTEEDLYVRGKDDYFRIVIKNLVDNALKYSDQDKQVEVCIQKDKDNIIVEVRDHGIGISLDEREKVFDRFYRGEDPQKAGIKGFGLGLSLVKSIVTAMNGKISISNNSPTGTIFIINLPSIKMT